MNLARAHRIVGLVAFALFIGTGIYLRVRLPALHEGREAVRILFRSNHIYLAMSATVNIALGLGLVAAATPTRRRVQKVASAAVLIAPAILFAAFVIDPSNPDSDRTLSRIGVILTVVGVLVHLLCAIRRQQK